MSDLIRREDVVEALYQAIRTTLIGTFTDSMSLAIAMANNLQSAEPEPKWIPVTEALPEEEKDVLVSVHFEGFKGKTVDLPPSDYVEIASHIEGVWSSPSDEYKVVEVNHHVIAWMPLPEPLRGNE